MDPIAEHPRPAVEPVEPRPDGGLVDLVDHALVHLDGLRDRPRLSSAVTALLVFVLTVGWGLTRWRSVEPIDDRIPGVEEMVRADAAGPGVESPGAEEDPPDNRAAAATGGDPPVAVGETDTATAATDDEQALVVVHVSGAVMKEGLVELTAGSRLADAISAAGGAGVNADVHRLNLATPLSDGMHIRVPEVGEEGAPATLPLIEMAEDGGRRIDREAGGPNDAAEGSVNINDADLITLQRLPGVGPAIAGAIVAWREDHGRFTSIDGLLDVPGIGPAKLAAMEGQVVL